VLATRGGDLFTAGEDRDTDMRYLSSLTASGSSINDLAWDATRRVIFTGEGSRLHYYNLISHMEIGSQVLPGTIDFVGVRGAFVYSVISESTETRIVPRNHPAPHGETNTPPDARFTISPETGYTTRTDLTFDASSTSDGQDPLSALRFRWDFDDDGSWDTPFQADPTVVRRFSAAGTKRVRLQVRDHLALLGEQVQTFEVVFVPDPGSPGRPHTPFVLSFSVTDVVFDPVRPYLYASQKANHKLYILNLVSGLVEREYTFTHMPESLAVMPDGSRLFVALLTREHSSYWFDGDHEGFIASLDLQTRIEDREFRIAEDPFDLVATSDGHLVVPSGSGQHTYIRVFDAVTGQETGSDRNIYQGARVALHPSEQMVYAADTQLGPPTLTRYDLLPAGRIVLRWGDPDFGEHRIERNVWPSPLGDVLVTRGGDVFAVGATFGADMRYLSSLANDTFIDALVWDAAGRVIFTGEGQTLHYYNLLSREEIGSQVVSGHIDFMGLWGGVVYSVISESTETRIIPREHPAPGGETNTPPEARFTVFPATGHTTRTDLTFNASSSTDAQDPLSALRFRWDFENDGIWDTPLQTEPTAVKRYNTAGRRHVRLEVRDRLALVDTQVRAIDVVFEPDAGSPGQAHTPFVLPFPVTDVVFDPVRPYLYASQRANHKLYVLNLTTGLVEREFTFTYMPESLAVTPDGSRLFVALLTREHSSYWFEEDGHEAYIAGFDLQTRIKDREYWIPEDPYDILATSDGHLVVPSGSGQWTRIRVFDAVTGQETGRAQIRQQCRLTMHPSEQMVYIASTDLYPSDIARYDLLPGGGIAYLRDSPYHGDHRMEGNVWASPLGDVLVTRGGDLFTAREDINADMRYLSSLTERPIEDLAWNPLRGEIITTEAHSVQRYDLLTYQRRRSHLLSGAGSFVGQFDDVIYALISSSTTRIEAFTDKPHAASGADVRVECQGGRSALVTLDGSQSTDPNSSPGTNDDIALFEWFEVLPDSSLLPIQEGEVAQVRMELGTHRLVLRVTDTAGLVNEDPLEVVVEDTLPPQLAVSSDTTTLWPPNRRMVEVGALVTVDDQCTPATFVLEAVISNEPDDAAGPQDGHTTHDIQGVEAGGPDTSFQLRAERAGAGRGRMYTATYRATDESGNIASESVTFFVQHDRRTWSSGRSLQDP
jgi:DNA-binding beta-propeller fold protein YncE/PKD repeat protein